MRKYYQTEWHGIQFSDLSHSYSKVLAGPAFYQAFYQKFFERYQNWGQLPPDWVSQKEHCAEFVLSRCADRAKILSVGCGLGAMEHYVRARSPEVDLFIHEVAPAAWRWIAEEFEEEHKFLGLIPACLPDGIQFDLIYFCAVDYALDDEVLLGLLGAVRPFLATPAGRCLLISASLQPAQKGIAAPLVSLLRRVKTLGAAVLEAAGLHTRGQFWGWMRTRREYRSIMERAGYRDLQEGMIEPESSGLYWISGR